LKLEKNFWISNTFGLKAQSIVGCTVRSVDELKALMASPQYLDNQSVVIGSGSNIIALPVVGKLVIKMCMKGIHRVKENKDFVWMKVGAGENWDSLVRLLIEKNIFGLENLAFIPGSVGAAPIQNIGAYGREVSEFVDEVEVFGKSGEQRTLKASDCGFGYRTSIFKSNNDFIIGSVTFKLLKTPDPKTEYPDLKNLLNSLDLTAPSPNDIADAVTQIRTEKLPDPLTHPNAGSFFKNPVVEVELAQKLIGQIEGLKVFEVPDGFKLSAAQLIDFDGWKNKPGENVSCWSKQPLVLVNQGKATASDVFSYAKKIVVGVKESFGVTLELEPSVLS
tara:strand:- start:1031 stop:2032 length:1002 start_codon:yes stop_codon:yes gene_type:complete